GDRRDDADFRFSPRLHRDAVSADGYQRLLRPASDWIGSSAAEPVGTTSVGTMVMTPTLHPTLVNGRFGDPALFVQMLHRREALMFDCGNLSALSTRDLLRVGHLFVSHMHVDHFIGFDALLRVNIGREKHIRVVGPPEIAERLEHKLLAYDWDLVERYDTDLV